MSDAIRPDEFSKYAPRWLREGTSKPTDAVILPSKSRLATFISDAPPWKRGPSPFSGDVRAWRGVQTLESEVVTKKASFLSAHAPSGVVERLLWAAAITSVAVSVVGALGVVLFPSAPRDERLANDSTRIAATFQAAAASKVDRQPDATADSKLAASDPRPAKAASSLTQATIKPSDSPLAAEAITPTPEITNAVYVVAGSESVNSSQTRLQQQPDPPVQTSVQKQLPQQPQAAEVQQPQAARPQVAQPPQLAQVGQPQQQTLTRTTGPQERHSQVPDVDEVSRLVARGEAFLAQGDVATARLLLERAAEARDPRAALALGATYDPNVLKNMGAFGIKPDPERAHAWYERAVNFGSDEAGKRITALAQLGR
jgi:hypothetical protein